MSKLTESILNNFDIMREKAFMEAEPSIDTDTLAVTSDIDTEPKSRERLNNLFAWISDHAEDDDLKYFLDDCGITQDQFEDPDQIPDSEIENIEFEAKDWIGEHVADEDIPDLADRGIDLESEHLNESGEDREAAINYIMSQTHLSKEQAEEHVDQLIAMSKDYNRRTYAEKNKDELEREWIKNHTNEDGSVDWNGWEDFVEQKMNESEDLTEGNLMDKYGLNGSDEFKYMMLSRMQSDCKYAIDNDANNQLWVKNDPKTHCALMRELFDAVPETPDWITIDDIDSYESQMLKESKISRHKRSLNESVNWDYFDKFEDVINKYMPNEGEGETLASQIVTAVNKLIYKWYNDGDVYDNVNSRMAGWGNDLSSYANWLSTYCDRAARILDSIYNCSDDDTYENILKTLADKCLDPNYLGTMEEPKDGSIYDCDGPFEFNDGSYNDEEDDYWQDDEDMYEAVHMKPSKILNEDTVPASVLDFKHTELKKVQDNIALIASLKAEDPANELYTDLLDAYDKVQKALEDVIEEDPVGTVVDGTPSTEQAPKIGPETSDEIVDEPAEEPTDEVLDEPEEEIED